MSSALVFDRDTLVHSKLHKVMKGILRLGDPPGGREYEFVKSAQHMYDLFMQIMEEHDCQFAVQEAPLREEESNGNELQNDSDEDSSHMDNRTEVCTTSP